MDSRELLALLAERAPTELCEWLQSASTWEGERLLAAYVGAGRRLGGEVLGGPSALAHWSRRSLGRVALILSLDERNPEGLGPWLIRAYREGDSREKLAAMRALPWVSSGERFVEIAIDCGRTNETELFSAIALDNPFAAEHYSEQAFNALVMKAAFLNLPLERVQGLEERGNAELARMGMEYIDERLSAQRPYPASLWIAIAPSNPPGALARMLGELQHSLPDRRLAAARGLSLAGDPRALPFLEERLAMEHHTPVQVLLEQAIRSARKSS